MAKLNEILSPNQCGKIYFTPEQIKSALELCSHEIKCITIHESDFSALLKYYPGKDPQWLCDHFKLDISICGGAHSVAEEGDPYVEFNEQSIMNCWQGIFPLNEEQEEEKFAKECVNKYGKEQGMFPFTEKYGDEAVLKYKSLFGL